MDWVSWLEPVAGTFAGLADKMVGYLPTALAALGLLLVGWLVGRLLRAMTLRGIDVLERRLPERLRATAVSRGDLSRRMGELAGSVVFWIVFILFFGAATDVLGLPVLATWLAGLTRFLPRLLLAALILLAGVLAGAVAREGVSAASRAGGFALGELLGRWTQLAIIVSAVVTAVDQVGIDSAFVTTAFTVILAAFLGASALAFGLGAKTIVSNMIGVRHIRQQCEVGQQIRLGETNGRIREITGTAIVLDTSDGLEIVPGRLFSERATTLLTKTDA